MPVTKKKRDSNPNPFYARSTEAKASKNVTPTASLKSRTLCRAPDVLPDPPLVDGEEPDEVDDPEPEPEFEPEDDPGEPDELVEPDVGVGTVDRVVQVAALLAVTSPSV